MTSSPSTERRDDLVLVLAPTGRDAMLAASVMEQHGFRAISCADMDVLQREIDAGAGAVVLAEEALRPAAAARLAEALRRQPPWSDLPVVLFSGSDASAVTARATLDLIARLGNVTVLDRPVRIVSLVSALQVALRARRRQYQVRDLLEQRERAVHDRDQFLAMLGHELRNPLAAIVFALDLLGRAGVTDDKIVRRHQTIERHIRHLTRLVDDLLEVSRVTSGKIVLNSAVVDLVALVGRCVDTVRGLAKEQAIDVVSAAEAREIFVLGDAVRLDQVVVNLLTNALKYTPTGGGVRIAVRAAGGKAEIVVEDTGIGIASDMLGHIFEPFTQVEGALDRSRGGLGLGLALVRSLVEQHGGAVHAQSEGLGRGSRFTVHLPLADAPPRVDLPRDGHAPATARACHIVLIEDNADVREGLQSLLTASGHRVDVAEDGLSGIGRVLALKPDVVLVDLGLPGADGFEVARAVRATLGDRVILAALSGYGRPQDRHRAREAGFDVHLTKPVTTAAIERMLVEVMRRP